MKKLVLAAVVLGGCIYKGPHVPTDLQGDVPIRIANRTSDPICTVAIMPFTGAARYDNWLGDSFKQKKIAPGGEREFKIKPGDYRLAAVACGTTWAAGTQNDKLTVQTATYVAIGGHPEAPPSYQVVSLTPKAPTQPAAAGGGEESGGEAAPADQSSGDSSTESGGESGGESSGESDSSSSSSGESSSQPAAAPANDCKPVGSVVNSGNECCTRATKLSPDHTKNLCCDPSDDSACS